MKKIIFFLLFFLLAAGSFALPVKATTIISPLLEVSVDPGQKQGGLVKVFNETSDVLELVSSIEPFSTTDIVGTPAYLPSDTKNDFLYWFELSQTSITLKPHQVAIIPFTVSVPANAVPGGYYAAIFWQTVSPTNSKVPVNISSKVGTLIFLTVSGELKEAGGLTEFSPMPKNNYFFSLPVNFLVQFSNTGNIHLNPAGTIELKNWLGNKEILPVNGAKRYVLPSSSRRFEVSWGNESAGGNIWQNFWFEVKQELSHFAFGRYTATLSLNYGASLPAGQAGQPQQITRQISFWLIPWRLIVVVLLAFIILAILLKINSKIKRLKKDLGHGQKP